jgi:hypothetical protein
MSNDLDEFASTHGTVGVESVNDNGWLPLELQRRKRVPAESSDMSVGPSTKKQRGEHPHFPAENSTPRLPQPIEVEDKIYEETLQLFRSWMGANPGIFPNERRLIGFELITDIPCETLRLWFQKQFRGAAQSTQKGVATSMIDQSASKENAKNPTQRCIPRGEKAENQKMPWVKERPYSCTSLCGGTYKTRASFKRHEEITYPQKGFACILCFTWNTFNRKDHCTEHARRVHPTVDLKKFEVARKVDVSTRFPRRCGFCGVLFRDWDHRIDHIADHFEKGWVMDSWKDPWTDPMVTEATSNENNEDNNNGSDDNNPDRIVDIFSVSIDSPWSRSSLTLYFL